MLLPLMNKSSIAFDLNDTIIENMLTKLSFVKAYFGGMSYGYNVKIVYCVMIHNTHGKMLAEKGSAQFSDVEETRCILYRYDSDRAMPTSRPLSSARPRSLPMAE